MRKPRLIRFSWILIVSVVVFIGCKEPSPPRMNCKLTFDISKLIPPQEYIPPDYAGSVERLSIKAYDESRTLIVDTILEAPYILNLDGIHPGEIRVECIAYGENDISGEPTILADEVIYASFRPDVTAVVKELRPNFGQGSYSLTCSWPYELASVELDLEVKDQNGKIKYTKRRIRPEANGQIAHSKSLERGLYTVAIEFKNDGYVFGYAEEQFSIAANLQTSLDVDIFLDSSGNLQVSLSNSIKDVLDITVMSLQTFSTEESIYASAYPKRNTSYRYEWFLDGQKIPAMDTDIFEYDHTLCPGRHTLSVFVTDGRMIGSSSKEFMVMEPLLFTFSEIDDESIAITGYNGSEVDVVIPRTIGSYTIRSIGKNAFSSSNISSIVLPNSVEIIEDEAFKQCENLESIMLPEGLISIGDEAFYECRKLATLQLPSTLLTIGSKAFMSCELITTLILPDSLTAFYSFAFSGLAIQSVKIPELITSIPSFAFSNCKNLKEVSMPIGISYLGWEIFSNTSLEILEWPVHAVFDNASLYILDGCESIRELYIPTGSSAFMISNSIGSGTHIERIILEDSKSDSYLNILNYDEMILNTYHTPLREFSYSVSEQEVTITDFSGNDLYVGIPEEIGGMPVTKIGAGAFRDCTQIKGIQIVSSIKSIDADAFMNCTNLEHIEFQDGIQEIGPRAFANCISLEYIQLPNSLRKLSELVFINASSLKRIVLPDGLQTIGAGNFQGCSSLQGIMIPRSVKDIGPYQFLDCSQLNYIASPLSGPGGLWATKWDAGFDGLYMWNHIADTTAFSHTPIDDATTILTGYDMGEEQSIQIPMFMEGYLVSRIGEKAFFEQPLTHITIPPSVTHIDGAAFLNSGVHDIEFPDSLQEIGNDSFRGCSSLESIQWPNNLEIIGARAFKDCVSLDLRVLPQSLCTIYDEAFGGCDSIDQISIPTNILLKYAIFQNCEGLTDVYFEMQEKPYNNYWLAGPNTELHFLQTTSELSFVGSVWDESPYVITEKFIGPENHVVLPNMLSGKPLTGINSRTFHAVANVKSVRITDGIESIGMHAFTLCPQLTEVYIADTVEKIGPQAFKDCPNLKTVFCEVSSKPEGWDDQWLGNTNPIIVWGYSGRW